LDFYEKRVQQKSLNCSRQQSSKNTVDFTKIANKQLIYKLVSTAGKRRCFSL